MTKKRNILWLWGVLVVLTVAAGGVYWQVKQFASTPLTLSRQAIFTLPAGTGRGGLEQLLEQQKDH